MGYFSEAYEQSKKINSEEIDYFMFGFLVFFVPLGVFFYYIGKTVELIMGKNDN